MLTDDDVDLDDFRDVVESLVGAGHAPDRIALAAAKLAHDAAGAADDDELDIPDARRYDRSSRQQRAERPGKHGSGRKPGSLDDRGRDNAEPTGYLYVAMGRKAGMRPGDLVGAIANEVGLEGRQIGPIRIADHFSVVGIPERVVDEAIGILNGRAIRGKSTSVRRYVE